MLRRFRLAGWGAALVAVAAGLVLVVSPPASAQPVDPEDFPRHGLFRLYPDGFAFSDLTHTEIVAIPEGDTMAFDGRPPGEGPGLIRLPTIIPEGLADPVFGYTARADLVLIEFASYRDIEEPLGLHSMGVEAGLITQSPVDVRNPRSGELGTLIPWTIGGREALVFTTIEPAPLLAVVSVVDGPVQRRVNSEGIPAEELVAVLDSLLPGPADFGQARLRPGLNPVVYLGVSGPASQVLGPAAASVAAVWRHVATPDGGRWEAWSPDLSTALRDFDSLDYASAYVVVGTSQADWRFPDGPVRLMPDRAALEPGLNVVSYLGGNVPVPDGLPLDHPGTAIWHFDPARTESPWLSWRPGLPAGVPQIESLQFGQAYFVFAQVPFMWEFPRVGVR